MRGRPAPHRDMTESKPQPVPVPTLVEIAPSLPSEAVKYDPEHPPLPGAVQRET